MSSRFLQRCKTSEIITSIMSYSADNNCFLQTYWRCKRHPLTLLSYFHSAIFSKILTPEHGIIVLSYKILGWYAQLLLQRDQRYYVWHVTISMSWIPEVMQINKKTEVHRKILCGFMVNISAQTTEDSRLNVYTAMFSIEWSLTSISS